ncbi:hypothetical protein ACFFMN_06150 [Planobispora siamensis]|uniref:Uncharacterized protein n=1 Tax=Planobispora siamensis TaxID=936338 RepID=A0A8J3WKK2_9ACTN|nr:hypothetical protein [Planobispora siamensis]GIH94234.1 hypothetical protein Psi01_48640 [Planobispora siamensis]
MKTAHIANRRRPFPDRWTRAFWAADEIGHACVTVEVYRRQPPLETKGRDEVVQVGYDSPRGALMSSDGAVELLIMVFPGKRNKPVVYR